MAYAAGSNPAARKGLWVRLPPAARSSRLRQQYGLYGLPMTMRAAGLLVVLATACSPGGTPAARPSGAPTAPPASTAPATPVPATPVETLDGDLVQFVTPSKNIACAATGDGLRCDIAGHDWPLPPRPKDCDADWGAGAQLGTTASIGICASDSANGGTTVVAYGSAVRYRDFRCDSAPAGLRCVNLTTGHGFLLSRARYDLF
jgi:hypothetical protein